MHVDKYGDNEPQILTFFKSRTKVIDIGRKSTQSKGKIVREGASALFRCPVISRKHAKITFADYGSVRLPLIRRNCLDSPSALQVQIVDLSSHHGTHILHVGELISKMITPEVPNVLSDGDVVTFGKSVGRDDTLVRPVTARVHLLFGTAPSPSPSPVPATPTNILRSTTVSSGRYGIYPNSSSSSSSRSSSPALSDGGDSDVEEIPRPPTLFPVRSFGSSASLSLRTGRFGLLRRLLPPIHTSEVSPPQAELPHSPISVSSSSPSPDIVEINPEPSVVGAWPGSVASSRRPSPSPDPVLVAALEAMDKAKDASPAPEVQDPMELPHFIRRSPARELFSCAPLDNDEEPAEVEIPEVHQEELEVFTDARSDCAEAGSHHNFLGLPSGIFDEYKPLTHPHWDECDASSLYSPSSPVSPPSYMDDDGRSPPADLFNARMESLKSRLADLEKQLLEQKHENAGNDFTAESSVQVNSQDSGDPAPAEASTRLLEDASAAVDSIKALVTGKSTTLFDTQQRSVNYSFVLLTVTIYSISTLFALLHSHRDGSTPHQGCERCREGARRHTGCARGGS